MDGGDFPEPSSHATTRAPARTQGHTHTHRRGNTGTHLPTSHMCDGHKTQSLEVGMDGHEPPQFGLDNHDKDFHLHGTLKEESR